MSNDLGLSLSSNLINPKPWDTQWQGSLKIYCRYSRSVTGYFLDGLFYFNFLIILLRIFIFTSQKCLMDPIFYKNLLSKILIKATFPLEKVSSDTKINK